MDKETRSAIERATQKARRILEADFAEQLEGTYEVLLSGVVAPRAGAHLSPRQHAVRERIVASIEHRRAAGEKPAEAVSSYLRDAAFTVLNRFAALEMIEARGLTQECVRKGEQSSGYREFIGLAPGVALLPGGEGYRIYLECLFDELSTEVKVLFDRRDPVSALWPRRAAFDELLGVLNAPELAAVWGEDETIGWVYQYFNSGDERRAMREASQAPRNSRELAVRNQFFTPRYVVRFLTENTLARIWIEMMGEGDGASRIAERCDFLVRNAERRGPRVKKDPRDLKLLDPACGSGHFLLYSFDLLLSIYEEAWADPTAAVSATTGRTLRDDYPDLASLRRAAPALILEQNLHGVDIDSRCAQIAALALWLRAQRAWQEAKVSANVRPRITETHIIVAEPMPGDEALVEEFAATLDPPLLGSLFRKMVAEMRFAGELGTLVRVESLLAEEIRRANVEYNQQKKTTGYLPGLEPPLTQGNLDFSQIDDDAFFDRVEQLLLGSLRQFAESAGGGPAVRKHLFAGDAAQGIALVDIVRMKYDVVLMNPPFGACGFASKKEFERAYRRSKTNIYAAFVERGTELLDSLGLLGAVTSRSGFFLTTYHQWREEVLLRDCAPVVLADLGTGVLDGALVEVAAYCLGRGVKTTNVFRLLECEPKEDQLRAMAKRSGSEEDAHRYVVNFQSFLKLPRSPFAYWVREELLELFSRLPRLGEEYTAARGAYTTADFRFYRLLWEVPINSLARSRSNRREDKGDVPLAKGGAWSPFYQDFHLAIRWNSDGAEAKALLSAYRDAKGWGADWSACLNGHSHYFRPGLTWARRSQRGLSMKVMPSACIFADIGPALFVDGDHREGLLALLAVVNSAIYRRLVQMLMAFGKFEVGVIQRTPVPVLEGESRRLLSSLARDGWSNGRAAVSGTETSCAFVLPWLIRTAGCSLRERGIESENLFAERAAAASDLLLRIDKSCLLLYGVEELGQGSTPESLSGDGGEPGLGGDAWLEEESGPEASELQEEPGSEAMDIEELSADLVSWVVGVSFGRFDANLATGERPIPSEPDPFDPLPVCSPGMLAGDDGLPLAEAPPGYAIDFPSDGILVDDPGHARDCVLAARTVFDVIFRQDADLRWNEAAAILDPKASSLRDWLRRTFFDRHIKVYSKSRRKAPIYWQVATPSASYSVWLYAHRLTADTFFHVLHDVIAPKLGLEERKLLALTQEAGPNPTVSQRKGIAGQEAFVDELRALREEITRVAPLWNPDLDDGVLLTMAPLWRLVPHNRAWQKELKAAWDSLCTGEYDWAHVAMHLWPERVISRCATDRSLAIAHGLEEVFWEEDSKGKWAARKKSLTPVGTLVAERTSPAVKAALKDLLDAPVPPGAVRATRRGARRNG